MLFERRHAYPDTNDKPNAYQCVLKTISDKRTAWTMIIKTNNEEQSPSSVYVQSVGELSTVYLNWFNEIFERKRHFFRLINIIHV